MAPSLLAVAVGLPCWIGCAEPAEEVRGGAGQNEGRFSDLFEADRVGETGHGGPQGGGQAPSSAPAPAANPQPLAASIPTVGPSEAFPQEGTVKSEAEVIQWIEATYSVRDVQIVTRENDNYFATAKSERGAQCTFRISQIPGGFRCEYKTDRRAGVDSTGKLVPGYMGRGTASPAGPTDFALVEIPDSKASGSLLGQEFTVQSAEADPLGIKLVANRGQPTEMSLRITALGVFSDQLLAGTDLRVHPDDSMRIPQITISWQQPDGEHRREIYDGNYLLMVQLGEKKRNGSIPGRIYLALPDANQSIVAGTFVLK